MSAEDPKIDPDYAAYLAQKDELKEQHMGKWVVFSGGQLVLVEDDRDTLLKKAEEMKITGFFFKEIVQEERVIHLGGPRRVTKNRD
mgnify:FL=1